MSRPTRGTMLPRSEWGPTPSAGAASFTEKTTNRKVARIYVTAGGSASARRPFVATTTTSIAATCSSTCPFKNAGCYVQQGLTKFRAKARDRAATGLKPEEVIAEEVGLIDSAFRAGPVPQDGARGGRDLRLHEGGDVGSLTGALLLGAAGGRWLERGGGQVWTYTHWWREIPRSVWGPISVLASVETPQDIEVARQAGYAAAIVVEKFPSDRAFSLPGTSARIIPCPAETGSVTCAACRLCIDRDLLGMNAAIAFEPHGGGRKEVAETLVTLGLKKAAIMNGGSVVGKKSAAAAFKNEGRDKDNDSSGKDVAGSDNNNIDDDEATTLLAGGGQR